MEFVPSGITVNHKYHKHCEEEGNTSSNGNCKTWVDKNNVCAVGAIVAI
jgi:hypothetical protein